MTLYEIIGTGLLLVHDQVYVITHNDECDDSDGVVVVSHS